MGHNFRLDGLQLFDGQELIATFANDDFAQVGLSLFELGEKVFESGVALPLPEQLSDVELRTLAALDGIGDLGATLTVDVAAAMLSLERRGLTVLVNDGDVQGYHYVLTDAGRRMVDESR